MDRQRIRFLYTKSDEYRVLPATGVYGGPTPSGGIMVHFFVEAVTVPDEATFAVKPDGTLGDELERKPVDFTITRELQVGVLLPLSTPRCYTTGSETR